MADLTVTAAGIRLLPGVPSFRKRAGGAGAPGTLVYIASDGDVEGADADVSATSWAVGIIVSVAGGKLTCADGDMVDIAGPGSRVTGFSGLTPGALYYASTTAGAISDARPAGSSGDFVWIAAIAEDATTLRLLCFTDSFAAA